MKIQKRIENVFLGGLFGGVLGVAYFYNPTLLTALSVVTGFLSLWFFIPVNIKGLKKSAVRVHALVFALLAVFMYVTNIIWIFVGVIGYAAWLQYTFFKKDPHFFETTSAFFIFGVTYALYPFDIKDILYLGMILVLFYILKYLLFQKNIS